LLACVGLYGVLSYAVARCTNEMGIRMALGAQRRDIFKLVVGHGLVFTLIGLSLGLIGAFGMSRLLTTLTFGLTATDPATYITASLLLLVTSLLACYLPARRAARVDPMTALRDE